MALQAKPKNILFITTDQQRQDTLPAYGMDFMQTPALDRLAGDGVVFDNCVAVAPVCQPCRAAFMSGQFPHVNGVPSNFRWLRPGTPTIARSFRDAGWQTAAIGKMHFEPWDNPEGFADRIIAEDKRHFFRPDHYTRFLEARGYQRDHPAYVEGYDEQLGAIVSPLPTELHMETFIGNEAVRWIENAGERPFFCWVSFNSPHDPYDPPAELASLYRDAPIPEPVGSAAELEHKPDYQSRIIPLFRDNLLYLTDYAKLDAEKIRRMREYYLATVTLVDRQIERILDALSRRGVLDETLIVFSSDHGDHLGDHGLPFKNTYYESALKVPLIVSGPGVAARRRSRSFVDWLDLHRTFLELAGIPVGDHVQGNDFSGHLGDPDGADEAGRSEGYAELLGSAMVTTDRYKLVLCDDGDGELYDLDEEPLEVHNHFRDPAYREIREELSHRLATHMLGHSRVRRFGGGPHPSDSQRDAKFKEIRGILDGKGYPGLKR
jgi:choline-sulfatase